MTATQAPPTVDHPSNAPTEERPTLPSRRAIRLVAERELRTRLVSKAFIAGVASTVGLVILGFVLGAALGGDEPTRIGIVGEGTQAAVAELEALAAIEERELEITRFDDVAAAEVAVLAGDVDAAVDGTTFVVERSDPGLRGFVSAAWQRAGLVGAMGDAGLDDAEIGSALAAAAPLDERELDPDDERDARGGIAFASVILLFISVQIAGAYILMGVLEEKTTKVVELILSSIDARDLLVGKVIGIGIVGLVQVAVLVGTVVIAASLTGSDALPALTVPMLAAGLLWFLIGYLLYGSIFAAGASLVSRQEDAQSALAPISIVIMASYFASLYVADQPETTASTLLSMVPPIAPFAMPGRIAVGVVEPWEVALSLALAVGATLAAMALAGRIYVRSVLHTDRALGWREAWRLEA